MKPAQRAVPDDAEVFDEYQRQVAQREYGAKLRTAKALTISPQHVTNVLERYTPPADSLAYVAPPCSEAYERERINAELRARLAACTPATKPSTTLPQESPLLSTPRSESFHAEPP